jgi:prepilin-type N-terminal cleavage/methylation domain-containing protein
MSPASRGYTLTELLFVVLIIGVITTLAYPSMQSITHRQNDLDAALRLRDLINKTRDQAAQRHRAYGITLRDLKKTEPGGVLEVWEATSNACERLADAAARSLVTEEPFGRAVVAGQGAPRASKVGVVGWRLGLRGDLDLNPLRLCVSPSGAVRAFDGVGYAPLVGVLHLAVQPFMGEGDWTPFGPPRFVEVTFSSGARLRQS